MICFFTLQPFGFDHAYQRYPNLCSKIPDSKIIFQDESTDYSEILQYSVLPFFTTNLTSLDSQWGNNLPNNRSVRPLSDEVAHQKFYACYLKQNQTRLMPLIEKLQDQWNKYDQM